MFGVRTIGIFDTEVVDDEAESDVAGSVAKQAWDGGLLGVAMFGEVFNETLLCEKPGLW